MKYFGGLIFTAIFFIFSACGSKTQHADSDLHENGLDSSYVANDSVLVIDGDTIRGVTSSEPSTPPPPKSNAYIIVDKPNMKLYVVENSDTLFKGPIACGRNRGDKRGKDDGRTPEGDFKITNIHDASGWLYHTNDGRWVPHVYGPWFLRLDAGGWQGIGIHGTNAPGQIGQRRSKGCIRLHNEDIKKVHDLAFVGMPVKVIADNVKINPGAPKTTIKEKKEEAGSKEPEVEIMNEGSGMIEESSAEEVKKEEIKNEPGKTVEPEKTETPAKEPVKTEPVTPEAQK